VQRGSPETPLFRSKILTVDQSVVAGRPAPRGRRLLGHGRDLRLGQPRKVRTLALPGQGLFPYHSLCLHANIHRKAGEV